VSDHGGAPHKFQHPRELVLEGGLALDHRLTDAGQCGDAGTNAALGVEQLLVLRDDPPAFDAGDADLDHAVTEVGTGAGGLDVHEGEGKIAKGLEEEGLVTRTADAVDKRVTQLAITKDGERRLERSRSRKNAWLAQQLQGLTPSERRAVEAVIPVLERITARATRP